MEWKKILMLGLGIALGVIFGIFLRTHELSFSEFRTFASGIEDDYGSTDPDEASMVYEHIATSTSPEEEASTTSIHGEKAVKVPVMVYHSVRPHLVGESPYQDAYDVSPELLESELAYITKEGYSTVSFADVEKYWKDGTPLPPKPVILSFDDGWRNEYEYAFPLLKKYHMKGSFFIFTNPINRKPHWMTWAQIKEMDAAGMEIGGHARTHPILTKITTDAGLDKEIGGGKTIIEQQLGHSISVFAYPFGLKNAQVEAATTRAGYTIARTVLSGVWNDSAHALDFHGTLSSDRLSDFIKLLNRP